MEFKHQLEQNLKRLKNAWNEVQSETEVEGSKGELIRLS